MYKIVIDSCGELTPDMKASGRYESVPLSILVDDKTVVDDETFDQAKFLEMVAASPNCPKSSCPSPEQYIDAYKGDEERVYVVTLSAELSGSHNSAVLAKDLYMEEYGDKQVHVFDSFSASIAQTLIGMKIAELEGQGLSFEEVVKGVDAYIVDQTTYFVLDSLEALRKNGRLTGLKALLVTALNIKPVMGATDKGVICQHGQARGIKKALAKMVEQVVDEVKDSENKILGIAHCNCRERAEEVKKMIEEKIKLKKILITETRGISTLYASNGGIIVNV
jgi:EDD domain protein, DegV family